METLDLFGRVEGTIWVRSSVLHQNGLLIKACNTEKGATASGRRLSFTRVAFSPSEDALYTSDYLGNVYKFDLEKNRYQLCLRTTQTHSVLAVNIARPNELILGCPDYQLKCYDTDTGELVGAMQGHESTIRHLSLHPNSRHALAVTTKHAFVWDLESFEKCRTLNGGQDVGCTDAIFVPETNTVLACFRDDSIHVWEADTFDYKHSLPKPDGEKFNFRCFASSQDGWLLVAGGRSPYLFVWNLTNCKLIRIIQLPPKIRIVKQLAFVPKAISGNNVEVVLVLSQGGLVKALDISSCRVTFQVGSKEDVVDSFTVSSSGRYLAAVSQQGFVLLYDMYQLSSKLGQPPAPLMKVTDDSKEERTAQPSKPLRTKTIKPTVNMSYKAGKQTTVPRSRTGPPPLVEEPVLDEKKMKAILKGFGEYPEKYRCFIWRCLLRLPENHAAYSTLLDKGTHPAFQDLHQKYPIKSRKLLRVLQRALSALAFWAPLFGEVDYLSHLAFPFAKLFQNNRILTFELIATLMTNWCSHWFEYFPNPPLNVLAMLENTLAYHDHALLEHFVQYGITSQLYAWPLLKTLLSEVLSRQEWLRVWDHVFSNHPSFLLLLVPAYLITARQTLLKCTSKKDFEFFFRHRNAIDVSKVIGEAYHFLDCTPPDLHPQRMLEPFTPLTKVSYPIFNKYPKFIVDYQMQERERIRLEEIEYLKQRQSALEMERFSQQRKHDEDTWYRQQELLLQAEKERRQIIELEEQKLKDQRERLRAMRREMKVSELKTLDGARQRFMAYQQSAKEVQLQRMDDEIRRKVLQRDQETKAAINDIEMQALEVETQKAALEQSLMQKHDQALQRLQAGRQEVLRQEEVEADLVRRGVEEKGRQQREGVRLQQTKLARAQATRAALDMDQQVNLIKDVHGIRRELQQAEIGEKLQERELAEKQLRATIKAFRKEEEIEAATKQRGLKSTQLRQYSHDEDRMRGLAQMRDSEDTPLSSTITDSTPTTLRSELTIGDMTSSQQQLQASPSSLTASVGTWAVKRDQLDRQEANLLSRVQELRQRLARSSASVSSGSTRSNLVESTTL